MVKRKIKPVWKNYKEWECYKNGMYDSKKKGNFESCINLFVSDQLYHEMKTTLNVYVNSCIVQLTNKMFNPVSWLGQATCNRLFNSTAKDVVEAWLSLSQKEQENANNIAKKVIEEWRKDYEDIQ